MDLSELLFLLIALFLIVIITECIFFAKIKECWNLFLGLNLSVYLYWALYILAIMFTSSLGLFALAYYCGIILYAILLVITITLLIIAISKKKKGIATDVSVVFISFTVSSFIVLFLMMGIGLLSR